MGTGAERNKNSLLEILIKEDGKFKDIKFLHKQGIKGPALGAIRRLMDKLNKRTAEAQEKFNKLKIKR